MYEQPEDAAARHTLWDKLGEIARRYLHKEAPDPRSFADVIASEEIERDLSVLENREQSFQEEDPLQREFHAMADVLEAIICEQGSSNSWFGDEAEVVKTSRFDDVMRGVDAVIEFAPEDDEKQAEHLALAIDITFNEDVEQVKLRKILELIDRDELAQVKYFDSDHEHGSIFAPLIVLGIDRRHVRDLAEDWAEGIDEHKVQKLAKHPVRDLLLIQAIDQCASFEAYAAVKGKIKAAGAYAQVGRLLRKSLENSGWKRKALDDRFARDEVHNKILDVIGKLPKKEQTSPRRRIIVSQPKQSNA